MLVLQVELNSVFREFPEYTLVARHTLGDDDAEYIYNNLTSTQPLFQVYIAADL